MLNLKRGNYLLTDIEVLDNITQYVKDRCGAQDWREHLYSISSYIAGGIGWGEKEVNGYFNTWLDKNGGK